MPYYEQHLLTNGLDALGVGASKFAEFVLDNTTIDLVLTNLATLANFDKWVQERNERTNSMSIQQYALGGFSVSGYQKLVIVLTQENSNVHVQLTSKSRGGQLVDWGANAYNIKRVENFIKTPDAKLTKRKVPGETLGVVLVVVFSVLAFAAYVVLSQVPSYY